MSKIKPRERTRILKSLKIGVVPSQGIHHLHVGRNEEVKAIIKDLEDLTEGINCFRLFIGNYGSGKTFLLSLAREIAHQKNLCVCRADLAPEKRLFSSKGHAKTLYSELVRQLSNKLKPQGDALQSIIEKILTNSTVNELVEKFEKINENSLGFDFYNVLLIYKKSLSSGDSYKRTAALRWIKGEYSSKSDAYKDLNIRTIINDSNYYDALKIVAEIVKIAGYSGLLIHIDEMVNILRISHTQTRKNNYEMVLKIINDVMQSDFNNLGIYLSGTPEFLTDYRRGLYSYEALKSRLEENTFLSNNLFDKNHPVIRISPLTSEEIYNLINRVSQIYDSDSTVIRKTEDKLIELYLQYCTERLGQNLFSSPREIIRTYLNLRDAMETEKEKDYKEIINLTEIKPDIEKGIEDLEVSDEDIDLKDFVLNP
tara:strand:- start:2322 stop:3599 length:1278 start_codon:yes stop_codon:yes gene_type:complete